MTAPHQEALLVVWGINYMMAPHHEGAIMTCIFVKILFNKKFITLKIKFQNIFQNFLICLLKGFLEIGQKSRVPIFRFPLRRHFKKIWNFFWNFILKVRKILFNIFFTKMPPYRLNWYHFWPFFGVQYLKEIARTMRVNG